METFYVLQRQTVTVITAVRAVDRRDAINRVALFEQGTEVRRFDERPPAVAWPAVELPAKEA